MASTATQETSDIDGPDDTFVSIHGRHIRNEAGGIVSKITDIDYVMRFLILGRTKLTYEAGRRGLKIVDKTEVRQNIESLIKEDKGVKVVELIKEISTNYRYISQDPVLYCLALCARSGDDNTKKTAYRILNDVCRIPTHLCQFIEYYTVLTQKLHIDGDNESVLKKENVRDEKRNKKQGKAKEDLDEKNKTRKKGEELKLQQRKVNPHAAYGWGRSFKHAISKWFLSIEPEYLACLLTKYRHRCGWSIKTVIRLAHIKSPDILVVGTEKKKKKKKKKKEAEREASIDASPGTTSKKYKGQLFVRKDSTDKQKAIGFILRYFRSNLQEAREFYKINSEKADSFDEGSIVRRVAGMLAEYDELRKSTNADFIKDKITRHVKRLRSETDVNRKHTYFTIEHISPKVLSCRARNVEIWRMLIQCIPGEALIRHAGFLTNMGILADADNASVTETMNNFETRLREFVQPAITSAMESPYTTKRPVHPFKLLLAILQYKEGHADYGELIWRPVEKVTGILLQAFEKSYAENVHNISKKICVAVDVSLSMKKRVNKNEKGIECLTAAAALAFTLTRIGSNVDVLIFSKEGSKILTGYKDFDDFRSKIRESSLGKSQYSDCTEPLKFAYQNKLTGIEAFVLFTVNENAKEVNEPVKGLKYYKDACGKNEMKFIICTMNDTTYTGRDRADPYMMDICGCDPNLALLIQECVSSP